MKTRMELYHIERKPIACVSQFYKSTVLSIRHILFQSLLSLFIYMLIYFRMV